jgi:hypothetical protein
MAGAMTVQDTENLLSLDDLAERSQHRDRVFLFDQLRVINLAGRIVEDHQQVIPAIILKPAVPTAIDV